MIQPVKQQEVAVLGTGKMLGKGWHMWRRASGAVWLGPENKGGPGEHRPASRPGPDCRAPGIHGGERGGRRTWVSTRVVERHDETPLQGEWTEGRDRAGGAQVPWGCPVEATAGIWAGKMRPKQPHSVLIHRVKTGRR